MELMTSGCKVIAVNILALIDTDYIINNYEPNDNPADPQLVAGGSQYLLCAGARGPISGQGTNSIAFKAGKGDHVAIRGLSSTNNADDAVIIYNVHRKKNSHVFRPFTFDEEELTGAVVPDPSASNGLPPLHTPVDFSSFDSKIKQEGTAHLTIQFGVYKADGSKQDLYGYFEWEVKVTVV